MPDQIYGVTWNGAEKVSYTYDPLGRLTNRKVASFSNAYTYEDVGEDKTTMLVQSVVTPAGTYSYTYDNIGNILSITDGTYTATYAYDSLNQLVRANDEREGKTYTYSYSNGNITEQKEYAYTTGELGEVLETKNWTYGDSVWSDLLTDFNGTAITYDEVGNPLTIGSKELSWLGRQLTQITDGEEEISYAYNGDGQRVSKTVNGTTTEFIYNGDILAGQKTGNDVLVFMYDNNGDPFGFICNGTEYYYIKNAQNDVTAIASADGTVIANYYYDSWGKLIETTGNATIAELNPIRYRSYYYDSETEWYYLNTRYYSPELCRFISSDGYIQTGQGLLDKNMFAYCENNPVIRIDPNGQFWGIVVGVICAVVLAVALTGCTQSSQVKSKPYSGQANCYAYALKLENDPRTGKAFTSKPQPGEFSGKRLTQRDLIGNSQTVKNNINEKVRADAKALNLNYTEVFSPNHVAREGNWVVALVYATDGTDYHWYRRNDDGTWSHKPGSTPVINWDASGNTITDPATCDRGIYDGFLGYYEVGPN